MNLNIQRVSALPEVFETSTMYIVRGSESTLAELVFVGTDIGETRRILNKSDVEAMLAEFSGGSDHLNTPRDITATGDADWTVTFDGSEDVSAVLTLTASGVTAGEYPVVTVDAKGRVTEGRALVAADIPSLPGSKITSAISVDTSGNAATADLADEATKLATARTINGVPFDGTGNIDINAEDTVARIAVSEKGVADGVATLDENGFVPSSQLPSYVDDVIEVANFAALPVSGEASKIYIAIDTGAIYRWSGSVYVVIPPGVGTADTALKLTTARSISITGDMAWTVNFDGSTNVTAVGTLTTSGITAGEYAVATYDSKGRATEGRDLEESDMPVLTSSVVESAASVTLAVADW